MIAVADTLATLRRQYPDWLIVFRGREAWLSLPGSDDLVSADIERVHTEILAAAMRGVGVLVIEPVTQDAPLGGAR